MDEKGIKLAELCTDKILGIGNTLFEKKDIHIYMGEWSGWS